MPDGRAGIGPRAAPNRASPTFPWSSLPSSDPPRARLGTVSNRETHYSSENRCGSALPKRKPKNKQPARLTFAASISHACSLPRRRCRSNRDHTPPTTFRHLTDSPLSSPSLWLLHSSLSHSPGFIFPFNLISAIIYPRNSRFNFFFLTQHCTSRIELFSYSSSHFSIDFIPFHYPPIVDSILTQEGHRASFQMPPP